MFNPIEATKISSLTIDGCGSEKPPKVNQNDLKSVATVNSWKPVTEEEVTRAINEHDPVFKRYLETNGTKLVTKHWIADLTRVMNQREKNMPPNAKGLELVFRFRAAYGPVNHVALGTFWRDGSDNLKLGILHQESIPVFAGDNPKPVEFKGQVFNNFDTRDHFKNGKAPIEESLMRSGLPDVMVSHCPYPARIVDLHKLMHDTHHPYGAFGPPKSDGMVPLTCFSVTYSAHNALQNTVASMDTRATLPHIVRAMSKEQKIIGNTNYEEIRTFENKGKKYDIESPDLQPLDLIAGFLYVGAKWGADDNAAPHWDISPKGNLGSKL